MGLLDQSRYTPCQLVYNTDRLRAAFHQGTIPIVMLGTVSNSKIFKACKSYFAFAGIGVFVLRDDASPLVSWIHAAAAALAKSFAKPTADS